MENTDFLFDAGKLKEIQNEIYEQSTMLFDLLFQNNHRKAFLQ